MKSISAKRLQEMKLPEPDYIIDGIIAEGYTILSAPRKIGKSWLAVQMCYAVATGGTVLGRKVIKGQAIYITLEETMKMSASRQRKTWGDVKAPDDMYYVYDCKKIDEGFIEELDKLIAHEHMDNVRLVVIDILGKIDSSMQRGEDAYHKDYRVGSILKEWTKDKGVAVVAITHVSKKKIDDDPYGNTMGTGGVTGSADTIVTIQKKGKNKATMSVIGRSLPEIDIDMRLENCVWVTDVPDFQESPICKAVMMIAEDGEYKRVTSTEIIKCGGLELKAKEVGEFLVHNADAFKEIGIDLAVKSNGNGANYYLVRRI